MQKSLPQEVEVWYLIPSLRAELAKNLMAEQKCSQKECAKILGLTEGAISQYKNSKRAKEMKFSKLEKERIKRYAKAMHYKPQHAQTLFYHLSNSFRASNTMCTLHKKLDKSLPKNCSICKGNKI